MFYLTFSVERLRIQTIQFAKNKTIGFEYDRLLERTTEEVLMEPMIEAARSWHRRLREDEQGVDDIGFLQLGVHRILRNNESGRDFFQYATDARGLQVKRTAFFDLFHSKARLELLKNTTVGLYRDGCHNIATDLLESFPQLDGLEVIAGDGHLLSAACHAPRDFKDRKVAPNSLFMLNVRNGLILPLASV